MAVYRIVGGDLAHADNGGNARFEFRRLRNTNEGLLPFKNMNQHYHGSFIN